MQKIKKGDAVRIEYVRNGIHSTAYGVVLSVSKNTVTLGHNFNGVTPIDISKIPYSSIEEIVHITPRDRDY